MWIAHRWGPYAGAPLAFCPAGQTLNGMPPDADPEILHVDTGLGRLDHHQPDVASRTICAAKLCAQAFNPGDAALRRMTEYVTLVDNAIEPPGDRVAPFGVTQLISGLNAAHPDDSEAVVRTLFPLFEAWHRAADEVVRAEQALARAEWFDTSWGPGAAVDDEDAPAQALAYAAGAVVYVYRSVSGRRGYSAAAESSVDLSNVADAVLAADGVGSWYLHPSKKLLLNGSKKVREWTVSPLTLDQLVGFVRRQ
jgi:hypothetical protein